MQRTDQFTRFSKSIVNEAQVMYINNLEITTFFSKNERLCDLINLN